MSRIPDLDLIPCNAHLQPAEDCIRPLLRKLSSFPSLDLRFKIEGTGIIKILVLLFNMSH
eukprot:765528-Hanusia_phi.AAC.2